MREREAMRQENVVNIGITSTIDEFGTIEIPLHFQQYLGIEPGDGYKFTVGEDEGVIILEKLDPSCYNCPHLQYDEEPVVPWASMAYFCKKRCETR